MRTVEIQQSASSAAEFGALVYGAGSNRNGIYALFGYSTMKNDERSWYSRMAISLPRVTLYSKPDCHLCDIAKERIANVRRCVAFELETVDITSDPVLYTRYRERIPVVLLEGEEVFAYRVSEKILTQKLREVVPSRSLWARLMGRISH